MRKRPRLPFAPFEEDANDKAKAQKKASEITEDDLKVLEKDIQTLTDNHIKEIDKIAAAKEKEILEI